MARRPSEAAILARQAILENEQAEAKKAAEKEAIRRREERKKNEESNEYNNRVTVKKEASREAYRNFVDTVREACLENALMSIFNASIGNTASILSEDAKVYNQNLITDYIRKNGASNIIYNMQESHTLFLSELACEIESAVKRIIENVDPEDDATHNVTATEEIDFFNNIAGDEDIHDLCDIIKMRVSRATEDFIQRNMIDKIDIKDMILTTKEKIENLKTGDDETDEAIATETTRLMKRNIKERSNRPHSVFEQVVINLTSNILSNDELKTKFVGESGKLDMDKIVEFSSGFYTLLEMVNTLKIEKVDDKYIREALSM